jgi:perosamine synthetase
MEKFIPVSEPNIGEKEIEYVTKAVTSGWISSLGEYILEFEKKFATYCERSHGVATANGTVALHLALVALEIGPGDEVIIPNFTFIATANAVAYTGAKVILVDVEPDTWNIDPQKIEAKITSRTKAIIPVPIYGHPCDMDPILEIAKKHKLYVIEDAAEAHGALYNNKKVGSFGDISCFSFYANKTITSGEGGMCLTNDEHINQRLLLLRDHAMDKKKRYWHDQMGFNYRMTNLQAAVGVAQLERIENFVAIKRSNAALYKKLLTEEVGNKVILPVEKPYAVSTFWMFSVLINNEAVTRTREEIMDALKAKGVDSRPFFYPLSDLPPYRRDSNDLVVSKDIASRGINLPSATTLTKEQIEYVVNALKEVL